MNLILARLVVIASLLVVAQSFVCAIELTHEYILEPGDVLLAKNADGVVLRVPILPNGSAVIQHVGVIDAAGKTLNEINTLVKSMAERRKIPSSIEVSLDQQAARVFVLGQVVHAGSYSSAELNSDSNSKTVLTITKALQSAGGLKPTADTRHIHVTRLKPRVVIDVDLSKVMRDGDEADLVLKPGDVVLVPASDTVSGDAVSASKRVHIEKRIRVAGAVKQPGVLQGSETGEKLSSIISQVGGFKGSASGYVILIAYTDRDGHVITERVQVDSEQHYSDQLVKAGALVYVQAPKDFEEPTSVPELHFPGVPENSTLGDFDRLRRSNIQP